MGDVLAGAGLEYIPMEPFAAGFFRDGRIVRFHRDIEATVASIAEHDTADAQAYRAFMHKAVPLVKTAVHGADPSVRIRPEFGSRPREREIDIEEHRPQHAPSIAPPLCGRTVGETGSPTSPISGCPDSNWGPHPYQGCALPTEPY